ncbi:MAG: hypothetical protein EXR50_07660 [Dehalococcoidia bacterium]|nr:hypothetical protein [Dehalococcoidia bacterium]
MDFTSVDSPEMAAFRKEVREYLDKIVPKDLVDSPDWRDYPESDHQKRRDIAKNLGSKGWLAPTFPKPYGGGGLSIDHAIVIDEELERVNVSMGDVGGIYSPAIMVWGTDEQKNRMLPPILTGQVQTWILLTEPHGGTDLASAKTTAIRDGDEYVINGSKTFVGSDRKPDQFWTLVLSDPKGPRHQNLSWIMIPTDLAGITIQPLNILSTGGVGDHNNSVFFEDVRVPAQNLVGGENKGWQVSSTAMEIEHGGGGDVGPNRILEHFFNFCKTNEIDPDSRDLIADVYLNEDSRRLFGLRNFWKRHAKQPMSYDGSQFRYVRRMGGLRNARLMQQIIGYMALTRDKEWAPEDRWMELFMRNSITAVHPGGTQNIDKVIIARRMGIGRSVKEEAGKLE